MRDLLRRLGLRRRLRGRGRLTDPQGSQVQKRRRVVFRRELEGAVAIDLGSHVRDSLADFGAGHGISRVGRLHPSGARDVRAAGKEPVDGGRAGGKVAEGVAEDELLVVIEAALLDGLLLEACEHGAMRQQVANRGVLVPIRLSPWGSGRGRRWTRRGGISRLVAGGLRRGGDLREARADGIHCAPELIAGGAADIAQARERILQGGSVGAEDAAAPAGTEVDSERQFHEVAEPLGGRAAGLLGEKLDLEFRRSVHGKEAHEFAAEAVDAFGGDRRFEEDPKVAALVAGIHEEGIEAEFFERGAEAYSLGVDSSAQGAGEVGVAAGGFHSGFLDIEVEDEEGDGGVEADEVDAEGLFAGEVVAQGLGGEGFMDRGVCGAAVGEPLAGIEIFTAAEEGEHAGDEFVGDGW